ncbi:MAG TPA: hypothetical protein VFJ70_05270 [Burkholderiales bacterium]|nr:hypothetical protein [Burkholderiales bacterium]
MSRTCLVSIGRLPDRHRLTCINSACELCTAQFGCGLEGPIAARAKDFIGILNGIDTRIWNPAIDRLIAERYSEEDPRGKAACKAELQRETGLAPDAAAPLVAFASRLTSQKMADVMLERLPNMPERHPRMQFAPVASGERALQEGFAGLARRYPRRVGAHIGYDEAREHRLHAGADILLDGLELRALRSRPDVCDARPTSARRAPRRAARSRAEPQRT